METRSGKDISKIGIGTYGIGGRGHRDMDISELQSDEVYIRAVAHALKKGCNFTELSLGYGHGNAVRLFKAAIDMSAISHHDVFLTNSLYPRDLTNFNEIQKDVTDFYRVMGTDYADSTLVTQSLVVKFGESLVFPFLHSLLNEQRTRFVSLSNASPTFIRSFKQEFGDAFIAHEGHISFEVRALQDKGVFDVCDELGVTNIIWRPLRRNMTAAFSWPLLLELTHKYDRTQNQIILNWITHLGYHPMIMSSSVKHIDENLAATDFTMSEEDYKRMNEFRPENYHPPEIDWEKSGNGDSIVTLVNEFESHIDRS